MQFLDEQTRAKNREFRRRVNDLASRKLRTVRQLAQEVIDRKQSVEEFRALVSKDVAETRAEFEARIDREFDALHAEQFEPLVERVEDLETDLKRWVEEEIPALVQEETGQVVRYLQETQEAFDIENAKIRKREQRFEERFTEHRRDAEFHAEAETERRRKFQQGLEEDMEQRFGDDDREVPEVQARIKRALAGLQERLEAEQRKREAEDVLMLGTLTGSLAALQQTVLQNFGSGVGQE